MSQFANMTAYNDSAVVARTFLAVLQQGGVFTYRQEIGANPKGWPTMTVSVRSPTPKSPLWKFRVVNKHPTLNSSGEVDYFHQSDRTYSIPEKGTLAERKDLLLAEINGCSNYGVSGSIADLMITKLQGLA